MNAALSDLFFMLDMGEYYLEGSSDEDTEKFLLDRATEFAGLACALGHEVTPEEVVQDYKDRA